MILYYLIDEIKILNKLPEDLYNYTIKFNK